ncbi:hypothetical protein GCM10027605_35360 [Micromonospora zhanjiangensis]
MIACPDCDGMTFTLRPCGCTEYGDRFLVEQVDGGAGREAYRDCRLCGGAGSVAAGCSHCRQGGRRRAQLVFTMVNLDTGAVASASVAPGRVTPSRSGAGWWLDLAPLLDDLADTVGLPHDTHREPPIPLPAHWCPDLPADRRTELEARAIVERDRGPWRVVLGRVERPAAPDPGRRLARLCATADLLLLDLVVEARRTDLGELNWEVRYELPGGDVPPSQRGRAGDLAVALRATDVADALVDLRTRGRAAPAHLLRTGPRPTARPDRTGPAGPDRWTPAGSNVGSSPTASTAPPAAGCRVRRPSGGTAAGGTAACGPAVAPSSSPNAAPARWSVGTPPPCCGVPNRRRRRRGATPSGTGRAPTAYPASG